MFPNLRNWVGGGGGGGVGGARRVLVGRVRWWGGWGVAGRGGARSANGEFVSGNYFRTFGLQPQAGRLFSDSDDVAGAPMTAVMSYAAWQRDYLGSAAVVGSTFWVNTKPVTVVGIAPRGFYGDRLSSNPPAFYLPINSMPVLAQALYVNDTNVQWL